jgi:hypothetical protein
MLSLSLSPDWRVNYLDYTPNPRGNNSAWQEIALRLTSGAMLLPAADRLIAARAARGDTPRPRSFACRRWALALMAAGALLSNGCMHRRLTVRSEPPGALVLVDGEEVGFTPTSIDYTYYGTREITLQKDGYKTLTTPVKLATPWYQVFPLEFVTDNFALTKINDRREISYALAPEQLEPRQDLEDRANNLRSEALRTEMPLPHSGQ